MKQIRFALALLLCLALIGCTVAALAWIRTITTQSEVAYSAVDNPSDVKTAKSNVSPVTVTYPDLTITQAQTPATPAPGDTVTTTIEVTNTGPKDLNLKWRLTTGLGGSAADIDLGILKAGEKKTFTRTNTVP